MSNVINPIEAVLSKTTEKEKPCSSDIPVVDLLDEWLDSKRMSVKASTLAQYRRCVETVLKPAFAQLTTRTVSSNSLRKLAEDLLSQYSVVTTRMILTITSQILQYMCDNGYADKKPQTKIKLPKHNSGIPSCRTLRCGPQWSRT